MIRRIGSGNSLIGIGVARIFSSSASCGALQDIDDLHLVFSLQIVLTDVPEIIDGPG